MSSKEPLIVVDWGDGNKCTIDDEGHTYVNDGLHSATIECWGVNTLTVSSLGNVSELTFGRR